MQETWPNRDDCHIRRNYFPSFVQEYPWQVSLTYSGQHLFGGSIVAPGLVVTGAHCVEVPDTRLLGLRVGITNLLSSSSTGEQDPQVSFISKWLRVGHYFHFSCWILVQYSLYSIWRATDRFDSGAPELQRGNAAERCGASGPRGAAHIHNVRACHLSAAGRSLVRRTDLRRDRLGLIQPKGANHCFNT